MMKPETIAKIREVKALQGLSVAQVCDLPKFKDTLAGYMKSQQEMRDLYIKTCEKAKVKPKAHTIERMPNNVETMAMEFKAVLDGKSKRPAGEREYILQIGMQAYSVTISLYAVEEFPELKDELFPPAQ